MHIYFFEYIMQVLLVRIEHGLCYSKVDLFYFSFSRKNNTRSRICGSESKTQWRVARSDRARVMYDDMSFFSGGGENRRGEALSAPCSKGKGP
jgi:hypothetical protein